MSPVVSNNVGSELSPSCVADSTRDRLAL